MYKQMRNESRKQTLCHIAEEVTETERECRE